MTSWFAADGLMKLEPDDEREPFAGQQLRTVKNENGIYFKGHAVLLYFLLGDPGLRAHALDFRRSALLLRNPNYPGIFHRHPGNFERDEAHDNYVALMGISGLMDFEFREDIIQHGLRYSWCYNSRDPEKFDIRYVRQPGDVAYYMVCSERRPAILDFSWFLGGVAVNSFQKRNHPANNPSTSLLAFFRIEVVNQLIPHLGWGYSLPFKAFREEWFYMIGRKYGSIAQAYRDYFKHPQHPLRELSEQYASVYRR